MVFPKIEQLRELPVQLSMAIPWEWEDRNGHVNVQFYLALYELGGWVVLEEIGVDEGWFSHHQVSQFDLEHHLNYRAELKVGDQVSTTLEYITASVDMNTRRTTPFREKLASGLDQLIEKHRALGWAAPVCGTMNP
jgi:acyl-CoA thioester hydrolase